MWGPVKAVRFQRRSRQRGSEITDRELLNRMSIGTLEVVDSITIVRDNLMLEEVESDGPGGGLLEGRIADIVYEVVELVPAALGVLVANVLAREGAAGGQNGSVRTSAGIDEEEGSLLVAEHGHVAALAAGSVCWIGKDVRVGVGGVIGGG